MPLHLSKVAVGCASLDALRERVAARAASGQVTISTRYRPTRHTEVLGGSIYWIIKHRLVARQAILGFGEDEIERKCVIILDARVVPVRGRPRRAHQGWRYLVAGDAPADFDGGDALADLPPHLVNELAALALV